jgi:nicotinamidase-related amidase
VQLTGRSALLVMDVQVGVVAGHPSTTLLPAVVRAATAARRHGVLVVYVTAVFRDGHPDVSPRHRVYSGMIASGRLSASDPGVAIHPDVEPVDGDIVVVKKRTSAFTGSDLEVVLRSQGVTELILAGVRTSGVVAATLREAADRDHDLVVLEDACADVEPDVHDMLVHRIFPRYATVTTVDEWAASLAEKA